MRLTLLLGCLVVSAGLAAAQDAEPDPVPGLIEELSDPEFEVREAATQTLIGLGEQAIEALEAAKGSDDPEVSWRAETALSAIREKLQEQQRTPQLEGLVVPRAAAKFRVELRVGGVEGMGIETIDGEAQIFRLENGAWVEEGTVVDSPFQATAPSDMLRAHLGLSANEGLAFGADNEGLERFGLAPFDVVLALDGVPVATLEDLEALLSAEDGAAFEIELIRRGSRLLQKVLLPAQEPTQTGD